MVNKFMIKSAALLLLLLPVSAWSSYSGPSPRKTIEGNQSIYEKYCKGSANSSATPEVNYENAKIKKAAAKLSKIADLSFYYYSGPLRAYGLKSGGGPGPSS